MWMEEEPAQRVNRLRIRDAVATQADIVVTACPFCLQMLEDAAGGLEMEKPLEVLDLVELLARALALPAVPTEAAPALQVGTTAGGRRASVVASSQPGQKGIGVEDLEG